MSGSFPTDATSKGDGLSAAAMRQIVAGLYPNLGVIKGLKVTPNANLTYAVASGVLAMNNGSYGTQLVYYSGGNTPAVAAGNASYSRYDTVCIKADDPALDNDSNTVHVSVVSGTPAASPAIPSVPARWFRLASFLVKPNVAHLNTGATRTGTYNYSIPYGASLGKLAESWDKRSYDGGGNADIGQNFYEQPVSFSLPTDRILEFRYECNFSASDLTNSEQGVTFQVDNVDILGSSANFVSNGTGWTHHEHTFLAEVNAGYHTARMHKWFQHGSYPVYHYGPNAHGQGTFIGQRFQVWDRSPTD